MSQTLTLTPAQRRSGLFWWLFGLLALPELLRTGNAVTELCSEAELNFLFFLINLSTTGWIFRDFLHRNFRFLCKNLCPCAKNALWGFLGCFLTGYGLRWCILRLYPGFQNANDAALALLAAESFPLLCIEAVLLAPITEELLYRGLLLGILSEKTAPWKAYGLSALLFGLIHVLGYLPQLTPAAFLCSLLQYLSAGLWLAWSCRRSGCIFVPMLIHALMNAVSMSAMR